MARRNGRPPRQERGFVRITHVRCPDCEDRGDLRNDGRARIVGGGQLRGASSYVGLTKATRGCTTCDGSGSISTSDIEALARAGLNPFLGSLDPYAQKPSHTG